VLSRPDERLPQRFILGYKQSFCFSFSRSSYATYCHDMVQKSLASGHIL